MQTRLSESIDHSDPVQLREFHKLTALLFRSQQERIGPKTADSDHDLLGGQPTAISPAGALLLLNKSDNSSSSGYHQTTDSERSASESPIMLTQQQQPDLMSMSTDDTSLSSASTMSSDNGGGCCARPTSETRQQQALALADRFSGQDVQQQRALLYNKIVSMLPAEMVQPSAWLSDVCQGVSGVHM